MTLNAIMTSNRSNNSVPRGQEQVIRLVLVSRYVASSYKQLECAAIIDKQGRNSGEHGIVEMHVQQ